MRVSRKPAVLVAAFTLLAGSTAIAEEPAAGEPAPQQPQRKKPLGVRAEIGWTSTFGQQVVIPIPTSQLNTVTGATRELTGTSRGNLRIGYEFPVGIAALLHFGAASLSSSTTPQANARAQKAGSAMALTLGLEGRYYPWTMRTRPFAFAEISRTFISVSESSGGDPVQEPQRNLQADKLDSLGVALGIGAEHAFTRGFAIGGKWGLDMTFVGYDDRDTDIGGSTTAIGTAAELYAAFRW